MQKTTECEYHDEAGQCDEECVQIQLDMSLWGHVHVPYDPTGCRRPKPMPTHWPKLDKERRAVVIVAEHPDDCQCLAPDCPAMNE